MTTTLGVSWEMTGTGAYTAFYLEVVWGVWMTRGRKYPLIRWQSLPFISTMHILGSLLGFGRLKTLPSSQMCLSEFQTYTGSLLLKASLSQLVAPCRNLTALFVSTNWLLGDDL